ncbi:hypothetical protein J3R30DRAFT_3373203 [Lentinula aciculospora]|uniref:J domain-containing protein n=1 Tax=Lentinula aciculospora TaxID=153920 RepID=A0A9W9DMK9_9AGAR|nr:hypothetical protein J3R30DRAFT_3373203 [Lentinula aciculospora]
MLLIPAVSFNLIPRCRSFSTSAQSLDHYKTLGVNLQASKAQIKSHFYQLSKKHHPDVSKDPKSKEIYTAVSAAYSVLSNDRERRAYDRKMQQTYRSSSSHSTNSPHPGFHPAANHNGEWSRRRPGATHAWAHRSHLFKQKQNTTNPSGHNASGSAQQDFRGSNPNSNQKTFVDSSFVHANVATDGDKSMFRRRTEAFHRDREKSESVSSSMRAFQVLLVLLLISAVAAPSMGPSTVTNIRTTYLPIEQSKVREEPSSDEDSDSLHGPNTTSLPSLSDYK